MLTTNSIAELAATLAMFLVAVSSMVILIASFIVIFEMSHKTNHMVRLYYTTISASAFYELMCVTINVTPTFGETMLCTGVALSMLFDRRYGVLCVRNTPEHIRGHHVSK